MTRRAPWHDERPYVVPAFRRTVPPAPLHVDRFIRQLEVMISWSARSLEEPEDATAFKHDGTMSTMKCGRSARLQAGLVLCTSSRLGGSSEGNTGESNLRRVCFSFQDVRN